MGLNWQMAVIEVEVIEGFFCTTKIPFSMYIHEDNYLNYVVCIFVLYIVRVLSTERFINSLVEKNTCKIIRILLSFSHVILC